MADAGALLVQLGNQAAFRSLIVGELPPATLEQAHRLLGDAGLLGRIVSAQEAGHMSSQALQGLQGAAGPGSEPQPMTEPSDPTPCESRTRRLFIAQQQRLSAQEMGVYQQHVAEAESVDEDFFGNFS